MADYILTATPPLGGYDRTFPGARLTERPDLTITSLAIPLGHENQATEALRQTYNLPLPNFGPTEITPGKALRLIRAAPDQILVLSQGGQPNPPEIFYTTDQTGAWAALTLTGPNTIPALERLCPLDLHGPAFPPDHAARTLMDHLGIWLIRETPDTFLLLTPSSSARSFLHAIETAILSVAAQDYRPI